MKDYQIFPFGPFSFPPQRAEVTSTFPLPLALHGKVPAMVWPLQEFLLPPIRRLVPSLLLMQLQPGTEPSQSHHGPANPSRSAKGSSHNGGDTWEQSS